MSVDLSSHRALVVVDQSSVFRAFLFLSYIDLVFQMRFAYYTPLLLSIHHFSQVQLGHLQYTLFYNLLVSLGTGPISCDS